MMKPHHTLLTILAVSAVGFGLMFVFPEKGIRVSENITMTYPTWEKFWERDTTQGRTIEDLLDVYIKRDRPRWTSNIALGGDTGTVFGPVLMPKTEEPKKRSIALNLPSGKHPLENFYERLKSQTKNGQVRILHYGDSQIEGDRITSLVRQKLQEKFGGYGPGFLPASEFVPNFSIIQKQSENWERYTLFGKPNPDVEHNRYGFRAIYNRFTPLKAEGITQDTNYAWVNFSPSKYGYSRVKNYTQARVWLGNFPQGARMRISADDEILLDKNLPAQSTGMELKVNLNTTPENLKIEFWATSGPDVYGISLESPTGVVMDNIAMRGASGTFFRKLADDQLRRQLSRMDVGLVILQYGGNTVPYIKDEKQAQDYGKYIASQIRLWKNLLPESSFVLIGPSDMGTKMDGKIATYPMLPHVKNALKEAALNEGIAYWDLFEIMGGLNSMPLWVSADPPLAASDYVHFTPAGARQVGEWLYLALLEDYGKDLTAKHKVPDYLIMEKTSE